MARNQRRQSIDFLLEPRSIAIVGASGNSDKLGYTLLKNVIDEGFNGDVYPVNPSGGIILGQKVFTSLSDLPCAPDLVLISIPSKYVPEVIEQAASVGAKAAVILASAFSEMGGAGSKLQLSLTQICKKYQIRIVGPNCMGIYNSASKLNGTYFWEIPKSAEQRKNVAFISQSGAYGGMFFSEITKRNFGISKFISIGNQCDLSHSDFLNYLMKDRQTKVVAMFIEEVKNPSEFLADCAALAKVKPVVILKVGRTSSGRRATLSHTGSMAGSWEIFAQAMRQCGAFLASDTDEFFDAIQMFSAYPSARFDPQSVAIATISGGPCVAASDACELIGLSVPELEKSTQEEIRRYIPAFGASKNPVDMTPQMNPDNFPAAVRALFKSPQIGGIVSINVGFDRLQFAEAFVSGKARFQKPVTGFLVDNPEITRRFEDAGIPIFPTPERASRALYFLKIRENLRENAGEFECRRSGNVSSDRKNLHAVDENLARKILQGIPFCREMFVSNENDAYAAAEKIGFPVAIKVFGAGGHKSDRGGVVTNIQNPKELKSEFRKLSQKFPDRKGFIVQEFLKSQLELIFGARSDETFGAYIIFGIGGIFTEFIKEFVVRLCPVSKKQAYKMIVDAPFAKLFSGVRGLPPVDIEAISKIIIKLSDIMCKNNKICEIDINPVIVVDGKPVAVDSLITATELLKGVKEVGHVI
ncbi:MAG: acetate--CoA ligase family protein [Planctomycetes bacterium]|nr:acetate--CoA ligase family protein [Planctomycetota bacterium]